MSSDDEYIKTDTDGNLRQRKSQEPTQTQPKKSNFKSSKIKSKRSSPSDDNPASTKKKQADNSKCQFLIIGIILIIAYCTFQFRAEVAKFVIPHYLKRATSKSEIGGEIEALAWANWLEKFCDGENLGRCCYKPDNFEELYHNWCGNDNQNSSDLDPLYDAIPLLSQCSNFVKNRHESDFDTFKSKEYSGKLTRGSSSTGGIIYYVKDIAKRKMKKSAAAAGGVKRDPKDKEMVCGLLKNCMEKKNSKLCKEVKKMIGVCY